MKESKRKSSKSMKICIDLDAEMRKTLKKAMKNENVSVEQFVTDLVKNADKLEKKVEIKKPKNQDLADFLEVSLSAIKQYNKKKRDLMLDGFKWRQYESMKSTS